METVNWRTELTPDSRQKIINKIMETLKRHLPFVENEDSVYEEGISELRKIAIRFEKRVLKSAVKEIDYLRKISMKMLTMEIRSPTATDSSSSSPLVAAVNSLLPLDHPDNSDPSITSEEQAMNTTDWRTQLTPDTRQKHLNNLMETLKTHVPYSGQEGFDELMRIAISFEELMFNTDIDKDSLSSFIILLWMI